MVAVCVLSQLAAAGGVECEAGEAGVRLPASPQLFMQQANTASPTCPHRGAVTEKDMLLNVMKSQLIASPPVLRSGGYEQVCQQEHTEGLSAT